MTMKRIYLTVLFASYYFFMPFVMVNCSTADAPYALDPADVSASESDAESQAKLEECQKMEFLIDECIDILQAESDRIAVELATIQAATLMIPDFENCQLEENVTQALQKGLAFQTTSSTDVETPATTEEDAITCDTIIETVVQSYQICDALTSSEKYPECSDLETAVDDAVELCDQNDDAVTEDFCSTLTA